MRYFLGISMLCIILMIAQTMTYATSQASQEDPFSEGSNWTYQLTKNSDTKGTGKYKGTSKTVEISKGLVNVTKSNSTVLIFEDSRTTYFNSSGTGFFKHKESENISQTIITTIDRQTLTIRSCKINDGKSDQFTEDKSLVGKPAIHFISTDLKGALNVNCFWGNETLLCSIGQGTINPHENKSSLVMLNYSGPKIVTIQTVTSFPTEGTIDCEFNYDEKTGLLLSYSTNETAKHSEGSCCWVKTDNIEQYDVYTVSLWAQQENPYIEVDVAEESSIDNMQIIMIAIGISAIIIVGYFLLYRRRNDSNNI